MQLRRPVLLLLCACAITMLSARSAGGPFKPAFGLSGGIPQPDIVSRPLVPVFAPSTLTRSGQFSRSQLRSDENCSTPNPRAGGTIRPSPDCDECNVTFPETAGNFEH